MNGSPEQRTSAFVQNADHLTGIANGQGDEKVIEKLATFIESNFHLTVKIKVPLKKLFPEPEKKYLRHFWNCDSHADLAIFRHLKLVCIVEPGGFAHFSDRKQRIRDKKKDVICRNNNVNCFRIGNSVIGHLDLSIVKRQFRKYFYSQMQ